MLSSFAAPPAAVVEDGELFQERVRTTASGLLGLLGIAADPLQSREHILIARILDHQWKAGRDLDLDALIHSIQEPPLEKVGVLDLESFYPAKERFTLAMRLNNLLASPGFAAWLEGEPLDVSSLLFTPAGKPRVSIISIAHLGDAERMFFVSLLLSHVLGWMRAQPGTSSLRAILYMDEIFGYFPPVANPPSKEPLLTLLKQARAFGLGVVLATQNPVDLDYKGLANTGTWFIGRLQTERDKARLLDGLEGAAGAAGFDRRRMEETLSALDKRVFLLHNVHESAPEVFQTRWTLSYLRGPLARPEIKRLMVGAARPAGSAPAAPATGTTPPASSPARAPAAGAQAGRPVLPPDVPQYFLPAAGGGQAVRYRPAVLGSATIYFRDAKAGVEGEETVNLLAELGPVGADWESARPLDGEVGDLERTPAEGASWAALPPEAAKAKSYEGWKRAFADGLYRGRKIELLKAKAYGLSSKAGESERDFRIRLRDAAREARDQAVEKLRAKYAPKVQALEERVRRARQAVERESEQARESKLQTAISFGTTILGAFLGRKRLSTGTVGRATTAARGAGRAMKDAKDVERAEETAETLANRLEELNGEFAAETRELETAYDPLTAELETVAVRPKKTDITVKLVALAWVPEPG
jgi:hypothetical protein